MVDSEKQGPHCEGPIRMLVAPLSVCVIGTRGFPGVEGGVERHCECLYTRMAGRADVLVYRRRPYVEPCENYEGVRFVDLPSTRVKGFEAVLHSFLATCAALIRKPDVVCYHNIGPALFSPLLGLRGIPVVLTYHSPNYEHDKWGGVAKAVLRFSERVALGSSALTIFVNRFQMERCADACKGGAVYIPNGVDAPAPQASTEAVEHFGLEPGRLYCVRWENHSGKGLRRPYPSFSRGCAKGREARHRWRG
ncbi:glycosyltransferase [Slackia equolifaciens]|uniref:glycosyltransferase n=2 Tax=Slackia equolifaciens TaxID=498718 RepID=UPI003B830163